jgi:hypothetical protein
LFSFKTGKARLKAGQKADKRGVIDSQTEGTANLRSPVIEVKHTLGIRAVRNSSHSRILKNIEILATEDHEGGI